MKTISPIKGIIYVIRTLREPAVQAAHETDAWLPMWNDMGMMVCPVLSTTPQHNLNRQALGKQH